MQYETIASSMMEFVPEYKRVYRCNSQSAGNAGDRETS